METLAAFLIVIGIGVLVCLRGTKSIKGKGIGVAILVLGAVILIATCAANYRPYNPNAAKKKAQEKAEEQWIQDNFGNGKGKAIQQAIDDYKND